jgi:hypothetical protein
MMQIITCGKCDHWYKLGGSVEGKCRCKLSLSWNRVTSYCATCDYAKKIVMPLFFENVVRVKA